MSGRDLVRRAARAGAGAVPAGVRGAAVRRLGPRLGIGGSEHGLVTLVVVCEAVDGPRLPDTLASIGEQTHGYREVLVVPVGPAAAAHARRTVRQRRDPRTRVLGETTAWQDAATHGADAAHGRWLMFLRACDPLPPRGLPDLVAALSASGSGLATGLVAQRGQPDEWLRRAQVAAHARPGARLEVEDRPELAGDLVVGNKLVLTDTWREAGLAFDPDDDWLVSPTIARLLLAVPTVDVLDVPVTEYLADHGNRAFGALPSSLPELTAWQRRAEVVEQALGESPLVDGWLDHVLDIAVPRFLKDAERATDAEWSALRELATLTPARAGGAEPDRVRAESRTLLWLAGQGRRDDVAALAAESLDLGPELATTIEGEELLAAWASLPRDLPPDVRALTVADTPVVTEVRRLRTVDDVREVDLFVRVVHLDLAAVPTELTAALPDGTAVPVEASVDPAATRWAQTRFQAAVAATVRVPVGADELELTLTAGPYRRSATVALVDPAVRAPDADRSVTVAGVALDGTDLVVDGSGALSSLRLVDDADRVVALPDEDGSGRVRFDLRHEPFGVVTWLPTGWYRVVAPGGNPTITDVLAGRLPAEEVGARHRLRAHLGPFGGLVAWLGPPLADDEQGPYAQERLVAAYLVDDRPVDPAVVYFESYAGRSATDSPLAIHEELRSRRPDLTTYWGILDHGQTVPEEATPVLLRSREWFDVLARAGCLVVNTDFEPWFRRRSGQFVLQTFHGYPSKGMGEGQWRAKQFPPSRLAMMRARSIGTWSAILTPTPEMTRHYREQYGYDGPAFDRGYPRDDALTAPGSKATRAATRTLLGIRDDQTAVLYAPTWRDHLATRPRGAEMADLLDVEGAARALGDSHVLLLRGHRFHAPEPVGGHVVDVTAYPEVNDLILAADVAVLDYSSLRFDFALTGKPMVFLVPDLTDYHGGTRSFLFPFEESAPGPFVDDTRGVVDRVRDVASLRVEWADALADFNARYHPWQDGRAAERVVDGLLDALHLPGPPPAATL